MQVLSTHDRWVAQKLGKRRAEAGQEDLGPLWPWDLGTLGLGATSSSPGGGAVLRRSSLMGIAVACRTLVLHWPVAQRPELLPAPLPRHLQPPPLHLVAGAVGDVALAVRPQHRPVCVHHRHRVVDHGAGALEEGHWQPRA